MWIIPVLQRVTCLGSRFIGQASAQALTWWSWLHTQAVRLWLGQLNRGHALDLLISKGLNISSIVIKDVALSDHFCIFFDILISATTESRSVSVRKRCINENTSALFMKALTPSISADSVDLLLDSFNSKVKNVIDDIAPVKVSKKTGRQKSSWRKINSSSEYTKTMQ